MANNNARAIPEGSGVTLEPFCWGDIYTGTKDALIKAGLCPAGWFPTGVVHDKRGRAKHTFTFATELGQAKLREEPPYAGEWRLELPITDEEKEKRDAEWRRECDQRNREVLAKQRADTERQRAESRTALGPFAAYAVGDNAILYLPGANDHLMQASIVKGYGPHKVRGDEDDEQGEELYGYIVLIRGRVDTTFVEANMLRDRADKPSHLKLTVDNSGR